MKLTELAAAVLAIAFSAHAAAQDVQPKPLPADHPLVGTWRIDLAGGCYEEYTLRPDGVKLSRSGEERNESAFEITDPQGGRGFYRWVDKITAGNGKPDCGGATTQVGHVSTNFVLIHPTKKKFLLCEHEEIKSCFAEFYRVGSDA